MTETDIHVSSMETLCIEQRADPCGIIIFGASGDLTRRKLLPSLYSLHKRGLMPGGFFVLGFSRTPMSDAEFRTKIRDDLLRKKNDTQGEILNRFLECCYYLPADYQDPRLYDALRGKLGKLEERHGTDGNRLFYLSTPPHLYAPVCEQLFNAGLTVEGRSRTPWRHVVVEKPLGYDYASARELNDLLNSLLSEHQIYRIDHYLGKETVQNIMMFRFANAIFEPIWNRQYIDHVQITAAENIGIEHRSGYYEKTGVLRDMFQNHMLQLLSLVAMEPPTSFTSSGIRDEKLKVLRSIRPFNDKNIRENVVRAQYEAGAVAGEKVKGYLEEKGVAADSASETYVAMRFLIDNWRWRDVPFYLRSGKRLKHKTTEIAITFNSVPHSIFPPLTAHDLRPNVLVFHVQPNEGISLSIQAKRPGPKLCIGTLTLDFDYAEVFDVEPPEAYERLLLDCMLGDQTLFIHHATTEAAWSLLMPILQNWDRAEADDLAKYPAGSWGPEDAAALLRADKRFWRNAE